VHLVPDGLAVSTSGTFGGFALQRISDGKLLGGAVWIKAMDLDGGRIATVVPLARNGAIPKGQYRLHLLTDDTAVVRVSLDGLTRNRTVVPEGSSIVKSELVDLASSHFSGEARLPVSVAPKSIAALAISLEVEQAMASYLSACITESETLCEEREDEHYYSDAWLSPASARTSGSGSVLYRGRQAAASDAEALFRISSTGLITSAQGFVLVLTFRGNASKST
jgi:hypothetical protein